jgi:endonuclease YncB( thermonuclease family)
MSCFCCEEYKLSKATINTQYLDFDGKKMPAKCVDVYDGDTVTLAIRFKGENFLLKCRLLGINSPEMKPPLKDPNREAVKREAVKARDYLSGLILNRIVYIECGKWDKYGRMLIRIRIGKRDRKTVNQIMIDEKLAVPYMV